MRPPSPNNPHFSFLQYSIRDFNTTATTAVVKNVLHRRALRHLETMRLLLQEQRVPHQPGHERQQQHQQQHHM
ncbi:hypothetical protein HanPSC8_Chr09g0362221 [Helianthus annuus]|nr:hypothetical protein HanPSC8_Chr09g0362221 [Helianthus annuus]